MKTFSWNLQGLGNPWTFSFSNFNYFVVDARGRSGGLILMWKKEYGVRISSYSKNHIDFECELADNTGKWRGTGIYGWPDSGARYKTWELLHRLCGESHLPWLVFGDFNEILRKEEKVGGRLKPSHAMEAFRRVLDDCGLIDLGWSGNNFTWDNGRVGVDNIKQRLDRFLATSEWIALFPDYSSQHLVRISLDHCPICLHLTGVERYEIKKRVFRFEAMWLSHPDCEEIVKGGWNLAQGADVVNKISNCASSLATWNEEAFGNIYKQKRALSRQLESLQDLPNTGRIAVRRRAVHDKLSEVLKKEEIMWRQRRKRNTIAKLQDEVGQWQSKADDIEQIICRYYKELFRTTDPPICSRTLEAIDSVISSDEVEMLSAPFDADEVKYALKQMHRNKAPGPDGMSAMFFINFWHVVGKDVTTLVLNFLETGIMPPHLNHTLITLIPKTQVPESMKDLRPISLCNVVYKLISKVLANRLKKVLPSVIHESQSAFVPGRLITDNAIIAFEMFHSMKHRIKSKRGVAALKLDMSKAYDRVEWRYIRQVMHKMGFPEHFITLIMCCISSVSFSFLINGQVKGFIKPSRGIRQGDPISPYLFLLCAEGLSALIRRAIQRNVIHGAKVSKGSPSVSHLLFADDCIIFTRATTQECRVLSDILKVYEMESGQQVNVGKSEISFSSRVPVERRNEIKELLRVQEVGHLPKYLGLPTVIGKSKKLIFGSLKERAWKKLKGWKEKMLSRAGKEVLIKAVAQAIPNYIMSCFLLPKTFCEEIQGMVSRFWWGNSDSKSSVHWMSWDRMCIPKGDGGLGFRNFHSFNIALLAKQTWRMMTSPDSLCARIIKAKYHPRCDILKASASYAPSYFWRSIQASFALIEFGKCWRVGRGDSIQIWKEKWICGDSMVKPLFCKNLPLDCTVDVLIDSETHSWKRDVVEASFLPFEAEAIFKMTLSQRMPADKLFWHHSKNGHYSVKSGYHAYQSMVFHDQECGVSSYTKSDFWKAIWKVKVMPKIKHFIWRALKDILPCFQVLKDRGIHVDDICPRCGAEGESIIHVLKDCSWAKGVWLSSQIGLRVDEMPVPNFTYWVESLMKNLSSNNFAMAVVILWQLWSSRNILIHEGRADSLEVLLNRCRDCYVQQNSMKVSSNGQGERPGWKPPKAGVVKLNTDLAVCTEDGTTGLGVIIRNEKGEVMVSAGRKMANVRSIAIGESLAILYGLHIALVCEFQMVEVESDALSVIQAIQKGKADPTHQGLVIDDILDFIPSFTSISFVYIPRVNNKTAHSLAKWALSISEDVVIMEDVPNHIHACMLEDVSSVFEILI
ncbi:uncharacterized protein LOC126687864 [Mercurialis annua]|uniref:uncharacterized protein LOC126687864 n=1 Tax=Mercurialis annua TaxID=3986 RepID=UPI00215DD912|nr:uncharacterized protein LOC126687864 [Mercurialis annua]